MKKRLFPEIQKLNPIKVLPNSISEFFYVRGNSQAKKELRKDYVLNEAKTILSLIPRDIQNYLANMADLVNSSDLEGQIDFFKTTANLAQDYNKSKVRVWAKDLLLDEKKISSSESGISYDIYEHLKKQQGKVNILEEKIPYLKNIRNLEVADNFREMEKNLISYGGLGVVIQNLEFKNPLTDAKLSLSCSISKNELPHTDPLWNNKRYRSGGDNFSNQHNYLCNLFEGTSAIAVSNNSFYASNSDEDLSSNLSFIERLSKKKFISSGVKRRQPGTEVSDKYSVKVDEGMRESFLEEKLMDGAFILSLSKV